MLFHEIRSSENQMELERLFGRSTSVPNTAIQILLNQGEEALKDIKKTTDTLTKILDILQTKNKKIDSIQGLSMPPDFIDTPLIATCSFEDRDYHILFDWTTSYLIIDSSLGGINGLSIEKKRIKKYSQIDLGILKTIFQKIFYSLCPELKGLEVSFDKNIKNPEQILFYSVHTPQTTGLIGLFLKSPSLKTSPFIFSKDFLCKHLMLGLDSYILHKEMVLSDIQKWEKGTLLELSYQPKKTFDVDFYCHTKHLFSSSFNKNIEEDNE